MGRLSNLRVVDPVLTTLARGYTNAEFVAHELFPFVKVTKESGKIPQFSKEAFKVYNTERGIRAGSNRINPEGRTTIDFSLTEHDLEYPIDYREEEEDIFPLEEYATKVVVEAIKLRHEKLCADMAQTLGSYASSNRITLSGTTQFTHASSHPIAIIRAGKEAVRAKIGKYPNKMTIGATAFNVLQDHPDLIDRIKNSQLGVLTTDLLSQILQIKKVVIGQAVYAADNGDFADLWGDSIVLAYVPETEAEKRTVYEPSFAYTLQKKDQPVVDKRDENGKLLIVRNTDLFVPKMVGAEAGYLILDTNA